MIMQVSRNGKFGLTLIEMLVVIAIVSILMCMLMPALRKAMDTARQVSCLNNHKQIYLALSLYAEDQKLLPPGSRQFGGPRWYNSELAGDYICEDIDSVGNLPYGTPLCCPSDGINGLYGNPPVSWIGYNIAMCIDISGGNYIRGPKFSEFVHPGKTAVTADARKYGWLYPSYWKYPVDSASNVWKGDDANAVDLRHNEGAVYGFADGHGKYLQNPDEYRIKDDLLELAR